MQSIQTFNENHLDTLASIGFVAANPTYKVAEAAYVAGALAGRAGLQRRLANSPRAADCTLLAALAPVPPAVEAANGVLLQADSRVAASRAADAARLPPLDPATPPSQAGSQRGAARGAAASLAGSRTAGGSALIYTALGG